MHSLNVTSLQNYLKTKVAEKKQEKEIVSWTLHWGALAMAMQATSRKSYLNINVFTVSTKCQKTS